MHSVNIVMTRPLKNKEIFPSHLNVIWLPVMAYEAVEICERDDLKSGDAYILTSKEAARFVAENHFRKDSLYYCVGRKTAQPLYDEKFLNVILNHGVGGLDLIKTICDHHDKTIPLTYLSGRIIKHPVDHLLNGEGFQVGRFIVYDTKSITFDDRILQEREGGVIVFYSFQSFRYFLKGIKKEHETSTKKWSISFVMPLFDRAIFLKLNDIDWKHVYNFESTEELISYFM